jgi:uncharacterized repeat protein (TIGR04052 family)
MRKLIEIVFIMVPVILYSMTYSVEKLIVFASSKTRVYVIFLVLTSALIIGGCSPSTEPRIQLSRHTNINVNTTAIQFTDVILLFTPHFQGLPVQCDQSLSIGNEQWHISELALFFSQFSLNNFNTIILDDNVWQSQQVALIRYVADCQRSIGNMSVKAVIRSVEGNLAKEVIPARGDKVIKEGVDRIEESNRNEKLIAAINNTDSTMPLTLSFNVGVPFAVNHQNPLTQASPLNDSSMFWAWRNGYKFIRWDMQNDMGDSWSFHLGSVGCKSAAMVRAPQKPCAQPNLIPVEMRVSSDSIQVVDVLQKAGAAEYNVPIKQIQINISIHLDEIIRNMIPTRKSSCMFSGIDNTTCHDLVENLKLNAVFK